MQFHNLKRNTPRKTSQIVGRGGKRGKTSGRGGKGQTARAGHKVRPEFRDILKKLPKLRGRGKHGLKSYSVSATPVNLSVLAKNFKDGETVSRESLVAKGIARRRSGEILPVKILGGGEIKSKLTITGLPISKSAKEAVEKAGGKIVQ